MLSAAGSGARRPNWLRPPAALRRAMHKIIFSTMVVVMAKHMEASPIPTKMQEPATRRLRISIQRGSHA